MLLFLALCLPWYIAVQMKNPEFFRVFILQHNLARFGTNLYQHKQPFWYYAPVILLSVVPWTVVAIYAAVDALRRRGGRSAGKPGDSPIEAAGNANHESDELPRFLLLWIAVPLVLFTISQSKLPGYILPAVAPCGLLLVEWLRRRAGEPLSSYPRCTCRRTRKEGG